MDARTWVENALRDEGHTPLPPGQRPFTATGFTVTDGPHPGSATITTTARYAGQEGIDQWGEAHDVAHRLLGVLAGLGAGWEAVDGREPDCVITVYPPSDRSD